MNGTPRLRSAYPSTPRSNKKSTEPHASVSGVSGPHVPLPSLIKPQDDAYAPIVPVSLVAAPSQRLYIAFFYLGLTVWRFRDYYELVSDETDSLWLFMKWVAIDGVLLYGLPGLRIPWLQWSSATMTILFLAHALLNAFLMFRIPLPFETWLVALTRLFYDRELAISERRVKPATILHNSSLILGKQIIHILPEGSATLNPENVAFCIDRAQTSVDLLIQINQTIPVLIELTRFDFDLNTTETIIVTSKEVKKLKKQAEKKMIKSQTGGPKILQYTVRKTGLYRLHRVVDESKLEVRRSVSDTLVVQCPSVSVKQVSETKCRGELSNFYLQLDATPPINVKYRKVINGEQSSHAVLSIPSENQIPPFTQQQSTSALFKANSVESTDYLRAHIQSTRVSLNESLGVSGTWQYLIDEIQDGCGNVISYSHDHLGRTNSRLPSRMGPLQQTFFVYERPQAYLRGCDTQQSLKVPKGRSHALPVHLSSTGPHRSVVSTHTLSYIFTPAAEVLPNQEHATNAMLTEFYLDSHSPLPEVQDPGLYTLQSVRTEYCRGEILEPSSCSLSNPPEPDLSLSVKTITDRCANNPVGLMVDLDLIGSPPFRVSYTAQRSGRSVEPRTFMSKLHNAQLELKPSQAGHYMYRFLDISDSVYKEPRSLENQNLVLEQDVKPPASAQFLDAQSPLKVCIQEPVSVGIQMSGEAPWILDYELVHNGRRQKHKQKGIENDINVLTTDKLQYGGDYTLALVAITDQKGCKVPLEQEKRISVTLQRPKAAFGHIEGKRSIFALEGKQVRLPLRLQGDSPWTVRYQNLKDTDDRFTEVIFRNSNDELRANNAGVYEILHVHDNICTGTVDVATNRFEVNWIPRPAIRVVESASIELSKDTYVKKDICEGDEDAVEVSFAGTPPFDVEYTYQILNQRGSHPTKSKQFTAGITLASIKMEAFNAGLHIYTISKLSDVSYNHDAQRFQPLTLQQHVHSRPSAVFTDARKVYKYCKEEDADGEKVPISLTGLAPFQVELEIRHHASSKPEIVTIPFIDKHQYDFHVPHRVLALGNHALTIRKVRDGNGCQRTLDVDAPRVQISVAEIPSITALETQTDYCVGDRISYSLSGSPPFNVYYTFQGQARKASVPTTRFRRLAEKPGDFVITDVSDQRSTDACKARTQLTKMIHELPSVRVSKGRTAVVDIHEGSEVEIFFEFSGTPPFEFVYTRSSNVPKGKKSQILETKSHVSYKHTETILASDEGIYEVVSIKDKFCAFSTQKTSKLSDQKLLDQ